MKIFWIRAMIAASFFASSLCRGQVNSSQGLPSILGALCQSFAVPSPIGSLAPTILSGNLNEPRALGVLQSWFEGAYRKHGRCLGTKSLSVSPRALVSASVLFEFADQSIGANLTFDADSKLTSFINRGAFPTSKALAVTTADVAMRDGTRLVTYVFSKPGWGAHPVVLDRSPYLYVEEQFDYFVQYNTARYFTDLGYVFVLQAIRGTPPSQGEYRIFNPAEVDDAWDTLEWASHQTFCNGKIAITGTSYEGFTALAAAVTNHPALKVAFAGGSPASLGKDAFRYHGLLNASLLDYLRYNHLHTGPKIVGNPYFQWLATRLINEPDLGRYDVETFGTRIPEWSEIAAAVNDPQAAIWHTYDIIDRLSEIKVPTYHIAGTGTDGDNRDVISHFKLVDGKSPYRAAHHLIVGPWDHAGSTPYHTGLGLTVSPVMKQRFESLLAYYLKAQPSPYAGASRVQVLLPDATTVIGGDHFPPASLSTDTLYFHAGGAMSERLPLPGESALSGYRYLPRELNQAGSSQTLTFAYQASASQSIVGELKAELYVRSDRPVTDIFLAIDHQDASGKSVAFTQCLMGGKIYGAGQVRRIRSEDCPIMATLSPGDKLRFFVTSNEYPFFFRVSEQGRDGKATFVDGNVELLHSPEFPSSVSWTRLR